MLKKIIQLNIYLIVFLLPLYLICFKIGWVPITFLELMIFGLFLIWLISKLFQGTASSSRNIFYPIFLIFLGATISTLFSSNIQISAGIWKSWFLAPLLFFIVLIDSIKTKRQIKNIFFALFLSGIGVSLISFFYWLNNNLTYDGRLQAFYLSPNYLAMYLSPILILSFYLYFCSKKNVYKIILFIIHCLFFVIIYLTYSFGAWLGLLGAFIFLIINSKHKKINFSYLLIGILLLLLTCSLFGQMPNQKIQGFLDFSYPSLKSRLIIWQSSWEIIKDHSLIGIGPGMFQKYYLEYQYKFNPYLEWAVPQPHNLFLAFWLQTGLIGLIGLIWLLMIFFRSKHSMLNTILMAAMIYILIHGLIDTTYWKNDLSVIFWLIIALSCTKIHFSRL